MAEISDSYLTLTLKVPELQEDVFWNVAYSHKLSDAILMKLASASCWYPEKESMFSPFELCTAETDLNEIKVSLYKTGAFEEAELTELTPLFKQAVEEAFKAKGFDVKVTLAELDEYWKLHKKTVLAI